jgi:hypothetical protein
MITYAYAALCRGCGRPRLLDLFCCAGGAGVGYDRAGFCVTGCDIVDRPNYPFHLIKDDALALLRDLIASGRIERFAMIHASPPCQEKCTLTQGTNKSRGWGGEHVQLVPEVRALLDDTGLPYVIEQPSNHGGLIRTDLMLCTDMFDMGPPPWVQRHRDFEVSGFDVEQPAHPDGPVRGHRGYVRGYRGRQGDRPGFFRDGPYVAAYGDGGGKGTPQEIAHAMGIDWTLVLKELTEAIPPVYTQHIGRAFLAAARLEGVAA